MQIIDIDDPAFYPSTSILPLRLRGRVLLAKSNFPSKAKEKHASVLAKLIPTLGEIVRPGNGLQKEEIRRLAEHIGRHYPHIFTRITFFRYPVRAEPEEKVECQNLLSGAIILGNLDVVDYFLRERFPTTFDLNSVDWYFGPPLSIAAFRGHVKIVRYLLERGANPQLIFHDWPEEHPEEADDWDLKSDDFWPLTVWHVENPYGSLLRAAIRGGHREIVTLLLEPQYRLPTTKYEYFRCFVRCARTGHLEFIHLLLEAAGKSISDFPLLGQLMLLGASECGHEDIATWLLDNGVDVNEKRKIPKAKHCVTYPINLAAMAGNVSMMRFLIERGAVFKDSKKRPDPPIRAAASAGRVEAVQLLLNCGANPLPAFLEAAIQGQSQVIALLLSNYPLLPEMKKGRVGRTAMLSAIEAKNPDIISLLVEAGVSINEGYTKWGQMHPVIYAKKKSSAWIVEYLLSIGAEDKSCTIRKSDLPVHLEQIPFHIADRTWHHDYPLLDNVRVSKRTWEWTGPWSVHHPVIM